MLIFELFMIDTSSFERNVVISEHDDNKGVPKKISFINQEGNVVKCYKYRIRKITKESDQQ